MLAERGVNPSRVRRQPRGARDHAVPRGPGRGRRRRGSRARRSGPRGAASALPTRIAPGASACGWATCSTRTACGSSSAASCPIATPSSRRRTACRRSCWTTSWRRPSSGARGCATTSPTRRCSSRTPSPRASTCCSRARRARCSTSTTAPTRTSPAATRWRAAPAPGGGVGPLQIDQVIGVLKAYSTRVGSGPFPTELEDGIGKHLLEKGREFGTTTGRRRRCGWFDAAPLRYAVAVNSVSSIMLNKLDILSGLPEIKLCTGYRVDGRPMRWPLALDELERAEPVYETLPGWEADLDPVRRMEDLPPEAVAYVDRIEALAGVPITLVSVGCRAHPDDPPQRGDSARPGARPLALGGRAAAMTPRTVLVVGSGGREHAIAWRLAGEDGVERVLVAPGNPGMADVAEVVPDVPAADAVDAPGAGRRCRPRGRRPRGAARGRAGGRARGRGRGRLRSVARGRDAGRQQGVLPRGGDRRGPAAGRGRCLR